MKFSWQHLSIVAIGLLVFVLLFFAEKTTLSNDSGPVVSQRSGESTGNPEDSGVSQANPESKDLLSLIPPLASGSPERDQLIEELGSGMPSGDFSVEERSESYRNLVAMLQEEGRIDVAAVYAGRLATEQPSLRNQLVAGALHRNASQSPEILEDEELFRNFSGRAIEFLEQALEKAPDDEDVLIEMGLAYVQSGQPENSMAGIQHLLKVLEINPNNAEAAFHLGVFSLQTQQLDKAEARFSKVLEIEPDNLVAKYYLSTVYLDKGRTSEALVLLEELAGQDADPGMAAEAEKILSSIKK